MTAFKRRRGVAVLMCALLLTAPVLAQPSAAQKETARGLMAEARELREQGDLEGALARFMAADSIMGVPTTGYEMAATQVELGKLVEARETLRRVLALPQGSEEPAPFREARVKARALDQRLQSRIGALRLVLSGVAPSETLLVTVDGEPLPAVALGVPFRVNPGKHIVVARAGEREVRSQVDALEGRTVRVELALGAPTAEPAAVAGPAVESPPPAATPGPASSSAQAEPAPQGSIPLLTYFAGGVGVAGLLVGGVTGIAAISHKNAAAKDCVKGQCPPSSWSDLDRARSMATVSTVGFVVGAVGLAVAASALLLREEPAQSAARSLRVAADVNPRGGSLTVAGRF